MKTPIQDTHQAPDLQTSGQYERIIRSSRALASGSDPSTLIQSVLTDVFELVGADLAQLWIADAVEGVITPVAQQTRAGFSETDAGNLPSRILATGQSVLANSPDLLSPFFPQGRIPYQSGIGVPIQDGQSVIGALVAFSQNPLGPSEFQHATLFGDQLSIIMRFETISLELERREREIKLFAETSRELSGELKISALMDRILDVAGTLFNAKGGFISLFEVDTGTLQLGMFRNINREIVKDIMERDAFRSVLKEAAPRVVPDTASDVVFEPLSQTGLIPIVVPLRADGVNAGLLVSLVDRSDMPVSADIPLISSFAHQAGLAVGNALLYQEIEDQRTELSSIIHSIRNPIIVIDEDEKFIAINGTAQELFSLSGAFDFGTPVRGRLRPKELEDLLLEGKGVIDVTITRPDPRHFKAKAVVLRGESGEVRGKVLVMDDITEQRELEQLKADFVAVIGHELRTPLTLIKGFTRTLMRKDAKIPPERKDEALETIDLQTHRLERLIEDLLFVSSIEQQRPPLHLEQFDLAEALRDAVDKLRSTAPDRAIILDCAYGRLGVNLDRSKIEQILDHLVDNALKYSEGQVEIALNVKDEEVHISVTDHGVGIYSGDIPRLFQKFGQIDSTSTRSHGGTGLGLYICKRLVEVHQGHIWCESQLGRGSTFTFSLPMNLAEAQGVKQTATP